MENDLLKLTNAVYKILEFFPENEPLKNKIKEKALEITEGVTPEKIDELLRYFKIAKTQGWLGSANYFIVVNEYEKLAKVFRHCEERSDEAIQSVRPARNDVNKLTPRQQKILEFLSKNNNAQVMDLQTVLPNVTKRTIRRDLDELLKSNRIVRTGDFNQASYKLSR